MRKWKIRALSEIKNLELFFKKRPNNIIEREASFVKKSPYLKECTKFKNHLKSKRAQTPFIITAHPHPYLSSRSRIIPFWSCYQKSKNLRPSKDTIVTFPQDRELDFFLTFTKITTKLHFQSIHHRTFHSWSQIIDFDSLNLAHPLLSTTTKGT